eukprot:COSAG05_NODE_1319_length_5194_cov_20.004534_2_plen_63_part_00
MRDMSQHKPQEYTHSSSQYRWQSVGLRIHGSETLQLGEYIHTLHVVSVYYCLSASLRSEMSP